MSTRPADVPPEIAVQHRGGECSTCGHTAAEQSPLPNGDTWLRRTLHLKPKAAMCGAYMAAFETGWGGPTDCECRDPFHGS